MGTYCLKSLGDLAVSLYERISLENSSISISKPTISEFIFVSNPSLDIVLKSKTCFSEILEKSNLR